MRIIATAIPPGSHELALWAGLPPGDVDTGEDIDLVCNLHHLSQDECVVTKAKGDLSDEANIEIGLLAHEMGYKTLHFKVRHGTKVSHWARFEKTVGGMDFYRVELDGAVALYRQLVGERGTQ